MITTLGMPFHPAMSLSLLKFVGQASLVDEAISPLTKSALDTSGLV